MKGKLMLKFRDQTEQNCVQWRDGLELQTGTCGIRNGTNAGRAVRYTKKFQTHGRNT